MANKDDLFTRAAQAAERVTEFQMDVVDKQALLKSARNRLKKAAADARALKKQVWEALGGKPRKRKPKERVVATMPDVVLGETLTGGRPMCWFEGCGRPGVAAVTDINGRTWEYCLDHIVASGDRDVLKENTDG